MTIPSICGKRPGVSREVVKRICSAGGLRSAVVVCALAGAMVSAGAQAAAVPRAVYGVTGSGWSTPTVLFRTNPIQDVSCPSASFCFAADDFGNAATWNGHAWHSAGVVGGQRFYMTLDDVTCVSASFCAAAVDSEAVTGEVLVTWNGKSWSAPSARIGSALSQHDVSCTSASFCIAVSSPNSATWNGSTWNPAPNLAETLTSPVNGVSCASPSFCVAVDESGRAVTWNGQSWSPPRKVTSEILSSVSCVSPSFCVAVNGNRQALRWNGKSWTHQVVITEGGGSFYVSCTSRSFCLSLHVGGEAATWNGQAWSKPSKAGFVISDQRYPDGLSCISPKLCAAAVDVGGGGAVSFWRRPT